MQTELTHTKPYRRVSTLWCVCVSAVWDKCHERAREAQRRVHNKFYIGSGKGSSSKVTHSLTHTCKHTYVRPLSRSFAYKNWHHRCCFTSDHTKASAFFVYKYIRLALALNPERHSHSHTLKQVSHRNISFFFFCCGVFLRRNQQNYFFKILWV